MLTAANSGSRVLKRSLCYSWNFSTRLKLFQIKSWKHFEESRRNIPKTSNVVGELTVHWWSHSLSYSFILSMNISWVYPSAWSQWQMWIRHSPIFKEHTYNKERKSAENQGRITILPSLVFSAHSCSKHCSCNFLGSKKVILIKSWSCS